MRLYAILKFGMTTLSAISTIAFGVVDGLNAAGREIGPDFPWQWAAIVSFVLFTGFGVWAWYDEKRKVNQLEDQQPIISVTPRYEGHSAWLIVHNNNQSHSGVFTVKVSDFGPTSKGLLEFKARWRHAPNDKETNTIMARGSNEADIIRTEGGSVMMGVSVFDAYQTPSDAQVEMASTISMRIDILTEPAPKQPFSKRFVLQLGENGNWNKFEEKS